jgi:hypothetical protein
MNFTIPNTPDGALAFGIAAFLLAFVLTSIIALALAAIPLLRGSGAAPAPKAERRKPGTPAPKPEEIVSEHEVAAISAAVAAMIGAHRIVHIEPAYQGLGWQSEGRAAHHGSHAVSHSGAPQRQPDNHIGNSHGA